MADVTAERRLAAVELHVAAVGTMRAGAIFCPLFAAFGPDPIRRR